MTVALTGEIQGELLLALRSADAVLLAARCMRQQPDEFGSEQTEALLKLVEAGANKFCSAAGEEYGTFTAAASMAAAAAAEGSDFELTAGDDAGNRISLLMQLNGALKESLALRASSAAVEIADSAAGKEQPATPLNLQLVLDVELNVTLRFGQRQLALREVLELTSGSVIELDRQVEEPVELLLEGKVIARGEAVVIDGNYGLRVTEVPQPVAVPTLR
jgi:flagellar motor switch protein FliN/FliY